MKRFLKALSFLLLAAIALTACGSDPAPTASTPSAVEAGATTDPQPTEKELTPVGSMMRHMSFNIFGTAGYPGFEDEEKRNNIKSIIQEIDPDTFGVQEANQAWTDGMADLLDGKYAMAGGHSDPKVENPVNFTNAIFYKTEKFTYLDSGIHFLNGDGSYISGKATNNCPFVLLERKEDGALILVLNVHLHWLALGSDELRAFNFENYGIDSADGNILRADQVVWSGRFAAEKAEAYEAQYGKPVSVLMGGDFNMNSLHAEPYIQEYKTATANLAQFGLTESALTAKELVSNQTDARWVTYRRGSKPNRLDYIFIDSSVLPETFYIHKIDQAWEVSSDHLPVYLDYYLTR